MMRHALHLLITLFAAVAWGIGNVLYVITLLLAKAAKRADPDSAYSNCWLHALVKWRQHGGYIMMREADGQRFLRIFPVPHAIWVSHLPRRGVELEQYIPIDRHTTSCCPWYTVYYRGVVRRVESPHPARDLWPED
jgi:hypothetical protein